MRKTFVLAVLVLTAGSIALGQEQSARRDSRRSVGQSIRQVDHERVQAQKLVLMLRRLTVSTLMILSA